MAATPDGNGYWLVASDGGIFSYGDASSTARPAPSTEPAHRRHGARRRTAGATGSSPPTAASSATATPSSTARRAPSTSTSPSSAWPRRLTGRVLARRLRRRHLQLRRRRLLRLDRAIRLNMPIVGMAPTADGDGYWLVAFDGGVFTFGDAGFYGSTAGTGVYAYGMIVDPSSPGYAVVTANGSATVFGPPAPTQVSAQPTPSEATTPRRRLRRPRRPRRRDRRRPRPRRTTGPTTPTPPATGGLQQGAYVGAGNPSGIASFAATDGDFADDRVRLPARQQRLVRHGRRRRQPELVTRGLEGDGLHALPRRADHPEPSSGSPVGTLAQGATGPTTRTTSPWRRTSSAAGRPMPTCASASSSTADGSRGPPRRPAPRRASPRTSSRS